MNLRNPETRFEELVARFREHGYRITPQRLALLRLLATSENHPSAAQLYEELQEQYPTTSLATVYKTLSRMKEMGEILELGFSDDDNRYDGNEPSPHPHLICVRCRKIVDPEVTSFGDLTEEVVANTGYEILRHRLDLYGVCPDCQDSNSSDGD
jgi:Fur family peroxide stress response transcriptional regulator